MKRKIQILKKTAFPPHPFFSHLLKGTEYYQSNNFERAAEEWAAANWIEYDEPIELKRLDGRIFCGGHIHEIPFLFFLYAIFANQVSGVGAIKTNGVAKNLIFNNGRLVRAGTTRREERIGNYILKRSNFTADKMSMMIDNAREQGQRIGRYLVERGLLAEDTLSEILSLQVEEIISDIFFWQAGHFYFLEKQIIRDNVVNYDPLNIARIAAQREFNFKDFRNKIPSNKIIFRPSPYAEGKKEAILKGLNVNHQFIFSLIDGARNIEQLIKFSGTDEVSVIQILYQLNAAGLIRQTREVAEYEDKEFTEISKVLEVLFEVYTIIYEQIHAELGGFAKEIVRHSRAGLTNSYGNFFTNIPLDTPESLNINVILRNIARCYPGLNEKIRFIDAFAALFSNLIAELENYLGRPLGAKTTKRIRLRSLNIVRFAKETDSGNSIFWPRAAFSLFCNPRNRFTMPVVAKTLRPCPEPKSTISGWTHNSEVCMLTHSLDNLTLSILIILTVAVYVVVMVVFFIARRKYKGGVVDKVIRYMIAAIGLFLLADITLILALTLAIPWGYSVHIILKILAMTCLTKGGLELFDRQP